MKRTVVRIDAESAPLLPSAAYDGQVPEPIELPQAAASRAPRVDAIRNRAAILEAAERLLRDHGVAGITMDRLACEAGVGKGTLFRRFGDRANLFHALLDESERRLQEGFIRGPAPLGPGAPPRDRLIAFGHAVLALTVERGDLLLAAQPSEPELRYRSAVHAAYRAHVRALLREALVEDPEYLADAFLAVLRPEVVVYQLRSGMDLDRCQRGWEELVSRALAV